MDSYFGEGFQADTLEWWDTNGDYHEGSPSESDLEDAFQLTVRIEYDDGHVEHYTTFSGDTPEDAFGWDEDEYYADIDDAADYYSEQ